MVSVSAIVTSHNRVEATLRCFAALYANDAVPDIQFSAVLVDDGGTDGTAESIAQQFPAVVLERGDGNLFWSRGMHRAQRIAIELFDPDYLLWLNDDTVLCSDALRRLLNAAEQISHEVCSPIVVVGATTDPASGELTYSGSVLTSDLKRFSYRKVFQHHAPVECDVMNGNIVLIPKAIYSRVGNLDPTYEHAMGDTDYALRVRRAGFRVFVAAGVAGYCGSNPLPEIRHDSSHSVAEKWAAFTSRKRLPLRSWLRFARVHGGPFWPFYFVQPYAKYLALVLWSALTRVFR